MEAAPGGGATRPLECGHEGQNRWNFGAFRRGTQLGRRQLFRSRLLGADGDCGADALFQRCFSLRQAAKLASRGWSTPLSVPLEWLLVPVLRILLLSFCLASATFEDPLLGTIASCRRYAWLWWLAQPA